MIFDRHPGLVPYSEKFTIIIDGHIKEQIMKSAKDLSVLLLMLLSLLLPSEQSGGQSGEMNLRVGPLPDGSVLVPSNQLLRPAGTQVYLPGRPVDLAMVPGAELLLVKNRRSLDLIRVSEPALLNSLPFRESGSSFTGLLVSADGRRILVTDSKNRLLTAVLEENLSLRWKDTVLMPSPKIGGDPVPGGLAWDEQNGRVYVTLSRNNTLAVVEPGGSKIKEIKVGIAPYDVLLASGSKAYVSNWGGRRPHIGESTYLSSGSRVVVDPETGDLLLEPSAYSSRPGVLACRWRMPGLRPALTG